MLGIEVCMQFQVNSLWCSVHGIRDFAPGRPGINTAWQRSAYAIHYRIGSRDLVLASGHLGSKHCSALKCTHGSDSNLYAVGSWFGSSPHGKAVTWLTNHQQASWGPHNAQLSNYLCSWFMHLVQFWCGSSLHSKAVMWRTNCHKASGMNQCNPLT